jgi:protein gp37
MNKTTIEWCDYTWNTTTGCTHVSDGCKHCYAEALSLRFGRSKHPWTKPFEQENVKIHPERLMQPFSLKGSPRVFVDSMSDLFHELVPDEHIESVFAVMALTPRVTYQILTKRPERMERFLTDLWRWARIEGRAQAIYEERTGEDSSMWLAVHGPLPNVWIGTSVEDERVVDRINWLVSTPAVVRFLSCEPLLGPIDLTDITVVPADPPNGPRVGLNCLTGYYSSIDEFHPDERIHWVITGGESGPHHRPFDPQWARDIRDQCQAAGVAYLHKQNGGRTSKIGGRDLDGRTWDQYPRVAL